MNFEGKGKKPEQSKSQENKTEKELSLSEIDQLLKESEKVSDNLDKFSKDEFYKKENFEDSRVEVDKLDDRFDEEAYAKAGFWKKFENFTRFGLNKERYDLIKSKDRGLLDKTKINKEVERQDIEIPSGWQLDKEREFLKGKIIEKHKDKKEEFEDKRGFFVSAENREITKRYEVVDGEIVKIIKSHRSESGVVIAAGKMREAEIGRLETVNGAELVGLKESIEKNKQTKENMLKMSGFMSEKDKQNLTDKLNKEEADKKERIKEKEEKIAEETEIFRKPLEGRLQETLEIENGLKEAFDFIKSGESDLNKNIKECEAFIKEAQKLNLSDEVLADIVKNAEAQKAELDARAKEFAERKIIISSRLEVLKTNKKEIEATLSRVNNIGKTKKEVADKEKVKKETKTETKPIEEKKENEKEEKTWNETRDEVWGLKNTAGKTESRKAGGSFDDLFSSHDYPERKKEKTESKTAEYQDEAETKEEIEVEENEKIAEKVFTHKEIEEIAEKELKALGIMSIKDRTMREQITVNVKMAVEAMIAKSKKPLDEEDIKKEVGDWYRKYSKNYFKKSKQPKQ